MQRVEPTTAHRRRPRFNEIPPGPSVQTSWEGPGAVNAASTLPPPSAPVWPGEEDTCLRQGAEASQRAESLHSENSDDADTQPENVETPAVERSQSVYSEPLAYYGVERSASVYSQASRVAPSYTSCVQQPWGADERSVAPPAPTPPAKTATLYGSVKRKALPPTAQVRKPPVPAEWMAFAPDAQLGEASFSVAPQFTQPPPAVARDNWRSQLAHVAPVVDRGTNTFADATTAMPPRPVPTTAQQVMLTLQRARAHFPKSSQRKARESREVAEWLRNAGFADFDALMRDVVSRRFEENSGKLARRGIHTSFGWLNDDQARNVTRMLARRFTYQEMEDWLYDEASLTANVEEALYPRPQGAPPR